MTYTIIIWNWQYI